MVWNEFIAIPIRSEILWTEKSVDNAEQGKALADSKRELWI